MMEYKKLIGIHTGWHLPKHTRMLHWKRMLSELGNLNALKPANRDWVSAL